MRALSRLGKRKNALSNIVAYVLLISITISLSVMVYGWLKFYVAEEDIAECPDGVNIVISNYECVPGATGHINVTLRNKGLFTADGFILRVNDREGADFGIYTLDENGTAIIPGESVSHDYVFSDYPGGFTDVAVLEVQPFMMEAGRVSCRSRAFQEIACE